MVSLLKNISFAYVLFIIMKIKSQKQFKGAGDDAKL